jgi:AraC family transcriptional regulator
MPAFSPIRFQKGHAMLLAGLRRRHEFVAAVPGTRAQWREFTQLPPFPGKTGDHTYGVLCGASENDFEYLSGTEVTDFSSLPIGTGRMRVPAQHYAVFAHPDPQVPIQVTWSEIMLRWLPPSGYQSAHTPDFEIYSPDFNHETLQGRVEIWLSVAARPAGHNPA